MAQSVGIFLQLGPLLLVYTRCYRSMDRFIKYLLITALLITLFGSQAGRNRTIEKQ